MKIYLCESNNFMGYILLGDLGQEYENKVYPKNKDLDINIQEKCLEMALFHIYSEKFIYVKQSPRIYLYNHNKEITNIDVLKFRDIITKNSFFKKYMRDTSQFLLVKSIKEYTEEDKKKLEELDKQLIIKENIIAFKLNNIKNNR